MPGDGPIPKRSDQRRRTNKPDIEISTAPGARDVVAPAGDPEWHPIARDWYASLAKSGQAKWYEPSDWMNAVYIAEAMSRNLNSGARFSAQLFQAVLSGMTELLTTEGARRRARIELAKAGQVDDDEVASVSMLDTYRARLGG